MQGSDLRKCKHPGERDISGYHKIQFPPDRYAVIDQKRLMDLFGVGDFPELQKLHGHLLGEELKAENLQRDNTWSASLAVGRSAFVESIKAELGIKARYRDITESGKAHVLREPLISYNCDFVDKKGVLND